MAQLPTAGELSRERAYQTHACGVMQLRTGYSAPVEIACADLEPVFGVTPGEHQVIVQLLKGYSSREIAAQFGKSILTVRTHVKRAYGKIGVKTRGQLFARLLPYLSIR